MAYAGIDYSGPGATCNRNAETGIRYGVISTHALGEYWHESAEDDYGTPTCPKCGNDTITIPSHTEQGNGYVSCIQDVPIAYEDYERARGECADYACEQCQYLFGSESAHPDEPRGWSIDDGDYQVINCLDSDAMICKSPYFTFAPFCSPCVPGACSLPEDPDRAPTDTTGYPRCYCFGHDWFDSGTAPYLVYSVATGDLVLAGAGLPDNPQESEVTQQAQSE